jgi:hypothetical protein
MNLIKYWPTKDEVDHCIKPEAEGAHDAVLLAVHQPSPLSYRIGAGEKIATTEDALYAYFTTPDVPMGAHVVPVTGASGVGKSHLVRMLAARLQSDENADRFVVIRIPKSASLRRVVELILAPLPDAGYAKVKQEFATAMEGVDIASATISFQAHLEIALEALRADLAQQVKSNPSNSILRQKLGHAMKLPKFIGDPVIVEHFRTRVFPRIVQRAVSGHQMQASTGPVEDFTAADFDLPDTVELGKAAQTTQQYYQAVLRADGGAGMRVAADLLNGPVVDQAMRQLFQLHQAIGGMTLQDVILEIRRLLLADGRELVILVEDFKALTGIQDTLLHVLIQEGVRDGKQELATMRSAIAVTDGYLAGQDTIATRAKREWIVESQFEREEEVLQRTKRLVASYLNAARWGHAELVRRYQQGGRVWSGERAWIEPFVDDDMSEGLTAFGAIDGVSLFPFTELAIERLARMALTQSGRLVFTPRFVIDHVLRNILLIGRDAYRAGLFPPPSLLAPAASAEVALWSASLPVSAEQRRRMERLVTIWGNSPDTRTEIGRIPPQVFRAFGLEAPGIDAPPPPPPPSPPHLPPPDGEIASLSPPTSPAGDPRVTELRAALESWVQNGVRLEQGTASQVRKFLEQAIVDRIDWNAERCAKFAIGANRISIPLAAGEGNLLADVIRIAPDHRDADGRLRTELVALLRFYHIHKRQADYDEVDDDLARIGNLVSRLMPQALALVRRLVKAQLQQATRLLATNSRVLGVSDRGRSIHGVSALLFGQPALRDAPPQDAPAAFQEWRQLQQAALTMRGKMREMLLDRCGCFQGSGGKAYGADIARLLETLPVDGDKVDIEILEPIDANVRSALAQLREGPANVRAKRVQAEAQRLQQAVQAELGENFDKQQIAEALRELAGSMQSGIWSTDDVGMTGPAFMRLCEEFRASALREALSTLQASAQLDDEKTEGKGLSRISQLDVNPLIQAHDFVTAARKVTTIARRRADQILGTTQGLDVAAQADVIRATFGSLLSDLDVLEMKGGQECC